MKLKRWFESHFSIQLNLFCLIKFVADISGHQWKFADIYVKGFVRNQPSSVAMLGLARKTRRPLLGFFARNLCMAPVSAVARGGQMENWSRKRRRSKLFAQNSLFLSSCRPLRSCLSWSVLTVSIYQQSVLRAKSTRVKIIYQNARWFEKRPKQNRTEQSKNNNNKKTAGVEIKFQVPVSRNRTFTVKYVPSFHDEFQRKINTALKVA